MTAVSKGTYVDDKYSRVSNAFADHIKMLQSYTKKCEMQLDNINLQYPCFNHVVKTNAYGTPNKCDIRILEKGMDMDLLTIIAEIELFKTFE
jgi:hypothetical protein